MSLTFNFFMLLFYYFLTTFVTIFILYVCMFGINYFFIFLVVLCCNFLGLAMALAKFCCQAMCNFFPRRKILKEKKHNYVIVFR